LAQPAHGRNAQRGGILTYMIPADGGPSLDGHRETTYAVLHATASVLQRSDPRQSDNPARQPISCAILCTEMPTPTDNGLTYTFKIRKGVKFHDGSPLTAQGRGDQLNKIVHPKPGVASARENNFVMVDTITAPDDETLVFKPEIRHLVVPAGAGRFPTPTSIPRRSSTRTCTGYEKTSWASGPFKMTEYQIGQFHQGRAQPRLLSPGPTLPRWLRGYLRAQAIGAHDAIRADRAALEFRSMPAVGGGSAGEGTRRQGPCGGRRGDWNCGNVVTPNHQKETVRRRAGAQGPIPWP